MKNTYFLLRHGETPYQLKKEKIIYPWPEPSPIGLTQKGKKEIEKVAKVLKKEKIDFIFSSDIYRAKQTAEIVGKELKKKIIFDKRLREVNFGVFRGKPKRYLTKFFPDLKQWFSKKCPQGESLSDVKKRLMEFIRDLENKYRGKNIVIVSHGDPLWLLYGILKGFSQQKMLKNKKALEFKLGELKRV